MPTPDLSLRTLRRLAPGGVVLLVAALGSPAAEAGFFATRGRTVGGVGPDPASLSPIVAATVDEESRSFALNEEELARFKQAVVLQYRSKTRRVDGQIRYRISGVITLPVCAEGTETGSWSFRFFANEPEPVTGVATDEPAMPSANAVQDVRSIAGEAFRGPLVAAFEGYTSSCVGPS